MQGQINISATLWRGARYFVGTLLGIIILAAQQSWTGLSLIPINLRDPQLYTKTLILAFVLGFIGAIGKILRDKYGKLDGTGLMDKLPL